MSTIIRNVSLTESFGWGVYMLIPNDGSGNDILSLTNDGIINGDMTLSFDQFTDNSDYILNHDINPVVEIRISGVVLTKDEAADWIEEFYNNPMIAYDASAGTGDMKKSTYDIMDDGIVDKSEAITFKTQNASAPLNTLIAAGTANIFDDVVGVHVGQGLAIVKGIAMLNVKNETGFDNIFEPGVSVYYGANGFGSCYSAIPGIIVDTKDHFYIGQIVEATQNILNGGIGLAKVLIDIKKSTIYEPNSDGKWLRSKDGVATGWTEEINGGNF